MRPLPSVFLALLCPYPPFSARMVWNTPAQGKSRRAGGKRMIRVISQEKAMEILAEHDAWIQEVGRRYQVPPAAVKAVLFKEMTQTDLMDPLADLAVWTGLTSRKDSSTGYGQIFGRTGLLAVNYALDQGLAGYAGLGIETDHRLSAENPEDIRLVWKKLKDDERFNIEVCAINLRLCAQEMTGRTDFSSFSDEETKLALTRYNANVRHVTAYGEDAFRLMQMFSSPSPSL